MKPKLINISVLLLTILVLAAVAVLSGQSRNVIAFDDETSRVAIVPTPTLSADKLEQKEVYSQEIQALFLKREKELLKPGWLHIVDKTTLRADVPRGFLVDDVPFPNEYVSEDWLLLDDESYVIKAAAFMRDLDGNILQRNVFIDGTWINLTLNDRITVGKWKPSADLGLLNMVKAPDTTLEKLESPLDDRSTVMYEIKSNYAGSEENVQGIVVRLYFDNQGYLIKSETVLLNVDGSEVVDSATEVLLMENVQNPSQDVIESYNEVEK